MRCDRHTSGCRTGFTLTTYDQEAIDRATEEFSAPRTEHGGTAADRARGRMSMKYIRKRPQRLLPSGNRRMSCPCCVLLSTWTGTTVRLFVIHSISQMKWSELPGVVKDSLEGADAKVRGYTRYSLSSLARNTTGQASPGTSPTHYRGIEEPGLDDSLARNLIRSLRLCDPSSSEVPSLFGRHSQARYATTVHLMPVML